MSATLTGVMPSATPGEADIAAWKDLPRDEQLRRLRQLLSHSGASIDCGQTMEDILAEARRRAAKLNRG